MFQVGFGDTSRRTRAAIGGSTHPVLLTANKTVVRETGCQSELHPIPSRIDKSYEWNEWELRRKAIRLTNLRQMRTHSTQVHAWLRVVAYARCTPFVVVISS